jgi:hypothetical protein
MMARSLRLLWPLIGLLLAIALGVEVRGQGQSTSGGRDLIRNTDDGVKYARGQNVVPVFEGWVANPDGTYGLVFGSWNRNWEEEVQIPIGPNNHFETGPADQGQPTYFYARRGKNLFEITVPKDFGKKELVWTLVSRGKTEKAYGALVAQEKLTRKMVLAGGSLDDQAAAGNDDQGDESDPNQPPKVAFGPVPPVTLSVPAVVTATVTDDGLKPRFGRGARPLRVAWSVYRGPKGVKFSPSRADLPSQTGGKISTNATFSAPGSYRIRAFVTDAGGLEAHQDLDITVK